jgi:hypothetical protein
MAVAFFMRVPELTLDRYDRMMQDLALDGNPPAGMVFHAASEGVGAVNVFEVWQTPEAAESFVARALREALERRGVKDPVSYRIEPLHNLYAPQMDVIERIGTVSLSGHAARDAIAS